MSTRTGARLLLATLGLLACATSASADCAWVLWEGLMTEQTPSRQLAWVVVDAVATHEACQPMALRAANERGQRFRSIPPPPGGGTGVSPEVTVNGNQVSVMSKAGGGFLHFTYLCLPDTVDPRGPKGK